jgi:hypothetical protein
MIPIPKMKTPPVIHVVANGALDDFAGEIGNVLEIKLDKDSYGEFARVANQIINVDVTEYLDTTCLPPAKTRGNAYPDDCDNCPPWEAELTRVDWDEHLFVYEVRGG